MSDLKVELLVLCDFALISREGKLSIIGIFDRIFAASLPSHYTRFFIVATIKGKPASQHQLTLDLIDPLGNQILPSKTINLKINPNGRSNFLTDVTQLPLTKTGEYQLIIKSDHKKIGSTPLFVNQISPGRTKGQPTVN